MLFLVSNKKLCKYGDMGQLEENHDRKSYRHIVTVAIIISFGWKVFD